MREGFVAALVVLVLLAHAHVCADHVFGHVFGHGRAPGAGLGDVLADFGGGEDDAVGIGVFVVDVHIGDVLGELLVGFPAGLVEDEEEDVEAGEQGGGEVDVLDGRDARVVPAVERVGGREDGRAGVEGGGDAGFGNGDGLLFHDFVDRRAVAVVHLVELVDAADAVVGEDQCSAFEYHFVGDGIPHDGRGEADAAAASSGGVNASGSDFGDVFEKLRFGYSRVADQADVDVAADPHAIAHFFGDAADEQKKQGLFDVEMTVDFRGDGPRQILIHVPRVLVLFDPTERSGVDCEVVVSFLVLSDMLGFEVCVCEEACLDCFEASVWCWEKDTSDIHDISRVDLPCQSAMAVHVQGSGDVANRHLIRHFLDFDFLKRQEFGCSRR